MKIIRVFPTVTNATPDDALARFGPPDLFEDGADEIHVSVAFTADLPRAERLAYEWEGFGRVKKGGPAYRMRSEEFVPGLYIKPGYVITSRGCPCNCWFCDVPKRENDYRGAAPREIAIADGWNILDDNLLACSRPHVEKVFKMLSGAPKRWGVERVQFTGGLWAAGLQDYQVGLLADLKPRPKCFFAYDPGDSFETLRSAAKRMLDAGFTECSHRLQVYVLCGFPRDTQDKAEGRMRQMLGIGFTPFAMLWRPMSPSEEKFTPAPEWGVFQRRWGRPAIIHSKSGLQEGELFAGMCGV